jgi:4-diphosphocytidyl-2C-methyl-D-erythritol kinase
VAHRRRLTLESGTVTVSGSGGTLFYVHDTTGKTQLGYALTKASIEIFPGDYRVTLSGVTVPATVRAGRDTAIAAGRLMAPGSGSTLYYVYNAAGTARLTYAMTNSEVELLPGEYQVELNSVRRVARVTAGQQSVVDR